MDSDLEVRCEWPESKDFYFEALSGMLPPQKRFDLLLFLLSCLVMLYLLKSRDELVKSVEEEVEDEQSKAVRRLQAMYFDMVCRMRPGSSKNRMLQLRDMVEEQLEELEVHAKPRRLLLLHASPLCVLTRAENGEPKWSPLPRLRINREIAAVERALAGALHVEVPERCERPRKN